MDPEHEIFREEEINTTIEVSSPYKLVFEAYINGLITLLLLKESMPAFGDRIDVEMKTHAIAILDFADYVIKYSEENRWLGVTKK